MKFFDKAVALLSGATVIFFSCTPEKPDDSAAPADVSAAHAESGPMPEWLPGCLDIHFINTGTGEATFIIMPDGTQMLVDMASADTKPEDMQTVDGQSRNVFIPRVPGDTRRPSEWINMYLDRCMAWTGNDMLDYVSVTHFHGDHIGNRTKTDRVDGLGGSAKPSALSTGGYQKIGAAEILDGNNVGLLVDRGYPDYDYPLPLSDGYAKNDVMNYRNAAAYHVANSGMRHETFKVGVSSQFVMKYSPEAYPRFRVRNVASEGCVWLGMGSTWRSYFPSNDMLTADSDDSADSPNENMTSTVFKLSYGDFDYYGGGDLVSNNVTAERQWRDAEKPVADAVGQVEVMKADHHGSVDGNTEYLLQKLDPQVVVVNTWRSVQPRVSTYERLKDTGADLFTTNLDSDYASGYSDGGAAIDSTHGHYVVRVNPDGTYYIYALDDTDTSMNLNILRRFGPYTSR